jgi:hypothetical protein
MLSDRARSARSEHLHPQTQMSCHIATFAKDPGPVVSCHIATFGKNLGTNDIAQILATSMPMATLSAPQTMPHGCRGTQGDEFTPPAPCSVMVETSLLVWDQRW